MNSGIYRKVQEIIDTKIRKSLNNHHGDIKLLSVEDNVVKVSFQGSCQSCPSAQLTLETLVERAIKEEVEEIERVLLATQVDESMLNVARSILNK